MRVLFVALDVYSGVGGMQRYCARIARALSESPDVEAATVVAVRDGAREEALAPPGVRFVACRRSKARAAAAFAAALRRDRPDVIVYGHVLLAPLALAAAALRSGARAMLLAYGVEVWRRPPLWRRMLIGRAVPRVVAISAFTARAMGRAYRLRPDRFRLLPPAVDPPDPLLLRRPSCEAPQQTRVLTVSRLAEADREKGVERIIRALPMLGEALPGLHLDVVGDGPLRPELERLAAGLGVGHLAHFLGRVDDDELQALYREASAFALPSRKEGFGIVYLEAWSHGVPVIAGHRDAGAEVVSDGATGLVVDPQRPAEIAGALLSLLRDPERAAALGAAGERLAAERYSHERFRADLVSLLAGRTAGRGSLPARRRGVA